MGTGSLLEQTQRTVYGKLRERVDALIRADVCVGSARRHLASTATKKFNVVECKQALLRPCQGEGN